MYVCGVIIMNYDKLEEKIEEISKTNLIYPYHLEGDENKPDNWVNHVHTWYHLMNVILKEYNRFSIEGYENYYSVQEQDMIQFLIQGLVEKEAKENVGN